MRLVLLSLCFSILFYDVSSLSSDGITLWSLLRHWKFVSPLITSSWNANGSTPCSWVGIQCNHAHNVISLNLTGYGISGQLGPEIGQLNHLQTIILSNNRLTGEIPVSVWRIPSLKHILVQNNSLHGELPLEMTELKGLENISLFDNQFSGIIPQSLGVNGCLVHLDLMNNKFIGNLPSNLCSRKQLRILNMGFNQLQGIIPADLGTCISLRRLILKHNNFTGPLPHFKDIPRLKYMDMSNNNINGEIPSSLGNCTNLTDVNLSMNKFSGLIPLELGKMVNLRTLNLARNNLEGHLPSELSNCINMDSFDVGFNFLNGSFPSSLRSWSEITTLILRENHFTGGIPDFLSEFGMLLELQLGGNLFGGRIPESIGRLPNLMYGLNLSSNGLFGEIPLQFHSLQKLINLDLSHNNLTGSVKVLDRLESLVDLNISYNSLYGLVPRILLNSIPSLTLGNPGLSFCCYSTDISDLNPSSNKPTNHKSFGTVQIVMIELASSIFVALLLVGLVYVCVHGENCRNGTKIQLEGGALLMKQVMEATKNLDDEYIIGRGAHGVVYKASLDPTRVYAVKKLEYAKNKRKILSMEREIQTIGQIRHRNLIGFEDFWFGKNYGLIFYEYMENGSLHDVLHDKNPAPVLKWNVRYNIAIGIARALKCLHFDCDPPIVHRDIKPKNILLDSNMVPHVSDFGIAIRITQSSASMGMLRSSYIAGTVGYMAPESANTIPQSGECDVYSYGVVLLEIITRKKVIDPSFMEKATLVGWVRSVWQETACIGQIVDPNLAKEISDSSEMEQVTQLFLLALRCIDRNPRQRPTMLDVIKQI